MNRLHLATVIALIAGILVAAANALIIWPLFQIEYTTNLHSNETTYATIARFLRAEGLSASWFPFWDLGMPWENTYLPLVPGLTALLAEIGHVSEINAYHKLCGAFYVLAAVGVFLLAHQLCNSLAAGWAAASCWSLFSPAALLFPPIAADLGAIWLPQRLRTMVYYGEGPHNVSLALLIWAVLVYVKARSQKPLYPVFLVLGALAFCANAFGAITLLASIFAIELSLSHGSRLPVALGRALLSVGAILLLALPWSSPVLYATIAKQSQYVGGDYTWTGAKILSWLVLGAVFLCLPFAFKRLTYSVQIPLLLLVVIGVIPILHYYLGIDLVPQPHRYHLELELIVALFVGIAAESIQRFRRARLGVALCWFVFLSVQFYQYRQFAWSSIVQANISESTQYRGAKWAAEKFGSQDRVFVGGDTGYLFNLFTDVLQVGSGHQPSTPNFFQSVGVFTILSGMNAGARDFQFSQLWLKAFGARAVLVPTIFRGDSLQPFANPNQFDGHLQLLDGPEGWKCFDTGYKQHSLFRLASRELLVRHSPVHGLDVVELAPFVSDLESRSSLAPGVRQISGTKWRIAAQVQRTQVIAVAMNYDAGWRAAAGGKPVEVRRDGLGLMVIEAQCDGSCDLEFWYDGGDVRLYSRLIGFAAWTVLGVASGVLLWRARSAAPI